MFPESFRNLLESRGFAVISTVEPDGTPQSSAVCFLLDDDGKLKFSLNGSRRKVQNLQRSPKLSVLFVDAKNPHRTLEVRGTATLAIDGDFSFRDKVDAKYELTRACTTSPVTRAISSPSTPSACANGLPRPPTDLSDRAAGCPGAT